MMPHPKKANCSQRSGSFWRTAEQPQMQVQASIKEGRRRKQPFKSLEEALGRHTDMMVRRMPLPTRTEPCTSVLRRVGPPSVITVSQRKARPMLPRSTQKLFPIRAVHVRTLHQNPPKRVPDTALSGCGGSTKKRCGMPLGFGRCHLRRSVFLSRQRGQRGYKRIARSSGQPPNLRSSAQPLALHGGKKLEHAF